MKCSNCKQSFTPTHNGQSVCSFECMKEKKSKQPKSKIKPVSEKRSKELTIYHSLKESWLSRPENRYCAVKTGDCLGQATEVHHKKGRENLLLLDQKYWLPICRNCHRFITDNSRWAINAGWSVERNK